MFSRRLLPILAFLFGTALLPVLMAQPLRSNGLLGSLGGERSILAAGGLILALGALVALLPKTLRRYGQAATLLAAVFAVCLASGLFNRNDLQELTAAGALIRLGMVGFILIGLRLAEMLSREATENASQQSALPSLAYWHYLVPAALLALLAAVMNVYKIENVLVYYNLMQLVVLAYLVHHPLKTDLRLPFFQWISILCLFCVFGLADGAWLLGVGASLIALCHLPVAANIRTGLLLAAGILLALLRAGTLPAPWSSAVWPILGSMFMFRIIFYFYDIKHRKEPISLPRTLSYFFLFPNIAFPMFPVMDFSAFRRTYYDSDALKIYRTGVEWMALGVLHLIAYRFVNYYWILPVEDVNSPGELTRYLLANFLLYLRLSGQFHFAIGMLHLFGFNLPLTHHLYYLSSSFTDFWRRINIYWKDFMLKVFYNPVYFKLKKRGPTFALIASTLIVFFLTWFFHAYQWFWLRGSFLFTTTDVLFWTLLALLVMINSLWETSRGRERSLSARQKSLADTLPIVIRTVGTVGFICILWSLWSSESLQEWLTLWRNAGIPMTTFGWLIPLGMLGLIVLGEALRLRRAASAAPLTPAAHAVSPAARFNWNHAVTLGAILLLLGAANPRVYGFLPENQRTIVLDLTQSRLGARDAAMMQKGYYEDLIGVDRFNSELWEIYGQKPPEWQVLDRYLPAADGLLRYELEPNMSFTFKLQPLHTNRWGMRDKDYVQQKPAHTYRIALLGSSHVMGSGVKDEEVFEALVEEKLHQERRSGQKVEILNFAVDGYSPIEQILVLNKVFAFQPDAVLFVAHKDDPLRNANQMVSKQVEGVTNPFDFPRETLIQAGVRKGMPAAKGQKLLLPYQNQLLGWVYQRIVQECQQHDALPVWIFLPVLEEQRGGATVAELLPLAEQAGFMALDLTGLYEGQDKKSLIVATWDWHPNAQGHRLIAERLLEALKRNRDVIPAHAPPDVPVRAQD